MGDEHRANAVPIRVPCAAVQLGREEQRQVHGEYSHRHHARRQRLRVARLLISERGKKEQICLGTTNMQKCLEWMTPNPLRGRASVRLLTTHMNGQASQTRSQQFGKQGGKDVLDVNTA